MALGQAGPYRPTKTKTKKVFFVTRHQYIYKKQKTFAFGKTPGPTNRTVA
jgi:hypothetical protein